LHPSSGLLILFLIAVFQSLGGSLIVSAAQAIFQNELINSLAVTSPNIDAATVLIIGASEIQKTYSEEDLKGINESYMKGLHMAFALAIAMAGAASLVAVTQPWFKLNKPGESGKVVTDEAAVAGVGAPEKKNPP